MLGKKKEKKEDALEKKEKEVTVRAVPSLRVKAKEQFRCSSERSFSPFFAIASFSVQPLLQQSFGQGTSQQRKVISLQLMHANIYQRK